MVELVEQPVGTEGKLKLEFVNGKLQMTVAYDSKGLDGTLTLALDGEYFIDELAKAIPGEVDDVVLAALKAALK